MFNIRKLINNIQDQDKTKESGSPEKANKSKNESTDKGVEGFLCPTCMLAFPSPELLQVHYESTHIDGAEAAPEDGKKESLICPACKMRFPTEYLLQSHFNRHHADNLQSSSKNDLQSLKMEVAELKTSLKEEKWHSDELKKEVDKMQNSVFNQLSYNDNDAQAEMEMMRLQNKALEESKSLLTSEVVLLRQQLTESYDLNKELKEQRERMEQRSASMSAESADVKSKLDVETDHKVALEEHLQQLQNEVVDLNSKLAERPSADDVNVLKQELVSVQTLMDQMTQKAEAEKSSLQLHVLELQNKLEQTQAAEKNIKKQLNAAPTEEDLEKLKAIINSNASGSESLKDCLQMKENELLEMKLKLQHVEEEIQEEKTKNDSLSLANKKLEELSKERLIANETLESSFSKEQSLTVELKTSISEKSDEIARQQIQIDKLENEVKESRESSQSVFTEKEQSFNHLMIDFERVQNLLKEKESQADDLSKELATVQQHYQEASVLADDCKNQLRERDNHIEGKERLCNTMNLKVNELSSELDITKETIKRLEAERTDLISQIEAGEGVNTALQQLTQENKTLQEKLGDSQKSLETQTASDQKQIESLHQQLQMVKNELSLCSDAKGKLDAENKENLSKLRIQQDRVTSLDSELKHKGELLLAAEQSKSALRVDLESHITSTKNILQDKTKECDKLNEKLEMVQCEVSSKKEENSALKNSLNESKEKIKHLENKSSTLENSLLEINEALAVANTTVFEVKKNLSEKSDSIIKLENTLSEQTSVNKTLSASFEATKEKLELEIKETLKSKSLLNEQLADSNNELKLAQKDISLLQLSIKEKEELHAKEKTEIQALHSEEIKRLESEKEKLNSIEISLNKDLDAVRKDYSDKNVEYEQLKSKFDLLDSNLNNLTAKVNLQETTIEEKVNIIYDLKSENERSVIQFEQLQTKYSDLEKLNENCKQESKTLNSKVEKSNSELETLKIKLTETECNLDDERSSRSELQIAKDELENKLNEVENDYKSQLENEEQLNLAIEDLTAVKIELNSSIKEMDSELKEAKTKVEELSESKAEIELKKENAEKKLAELVESHSSIANSMKELSESFEKYKKESSSEIIDLKDAKELLLKQKVQNQNTIKELEGNLQKEIGKFESFQNKWTNERLMMTNEAEELKARLEEEIIAHKTINQQKEENDTRNEMQLSVLTENLSELRKDLVMEQDKNEEVEKRVDELTGEKLELQAKLENAMDERRALLERCLGSETECEKLRAATADLRKRYDESLAAMHELGRENQTLQIETQKFHGRKWADDSLVNNCNTCTKAFSVTVRKHHCRKCGNIFCNECSSKQATIASSKKPVRVCDTCYQEVGGH